jgi:hypothetical protein
MRWLRLTCGWMLCAVGVVVLVSVIISYLSDMVQRKADGLPLVGVLAIGTLLGVCPAFLGWTLVRRKVQQPAMQSLSPVPGGEQPLTVTAEPLTIAAELRQGDLTRAMYWLFRNNYFVRFRSPGMA